MYVCMYEYIYIYVHKIDSRSAGRPEVPRGELFICFMFVSLKSIVCLCSTFVCRSPKSCVSLGRRRSSEASCWSRSSGSRRGSMFLPFFASGDVFFFITIHTDHVYILYMYNQTCVNIYIYIYICICRERER